MCAYHMCVWCLHKVEKGIRSLETGVPEDLGESNPGPLQEEQVLLAAEPSLQAPKYIFLFHTAWTLDADTCFCLLSL